VPHPQGVCHCDIKLENLLLDTKGGSAPRLKIGGLDYSTRPQEQPTAAVSLAGTAAYMAPEVLQHKQVRGPPVVFWTVLHSVS